MMDPIKDGSPLKLTDLLFSKVPVNIFSSFLETDVTRTGRVFPTSSLAFFSIEISKALVSSLNLLTFVL